MGSPEVAPPSKGEKNYPTLYLEWDDDYELPKSGTMTVKFVKRSETNTKRDDGTQRQDVTLEIKSIDSVNGSKKSLKVKDDDEDGGKALDKLKEEAEDEESDSY